MSELMTVKVIKDHYHRLRNCGRAHRGDISSSKVQGDEVPWVSIYSFWAVLREANA
jgi:hypothetical protein